MNSRRRCRCHIRSIRAERKIRLSSCPTVRPCMCGSRLTTAWMWSNRRRTRSPASTNWLSRAMAGARPNAYGWPIRANRNWMGAASSRAIRCGSARSGQGLEGMHWFTSTYENGQWSKAVLADYNPDYQVGELYISNDGNDLYFHSARPSGKGGLDIWVSHKLEGIWQEPQNLENVNSAGDEGWPVLNPQEDELWITKDYGLWRSKKVDGVWRAP